MNRSAYLLRIIALLSIVLISACELGWFEDESDEAMTSRHGSDESHNLGRNCMECHTSGGCAYPMPMATSLLPSARWPVSANYWTGILVSRV